MNSEIELSFEEELTLLGIDQSNAFFEKRILFNSPGFVPKIFARVDLLPDENLKTRDVRVYFNKEELPFSKEGNNLVFELENLSPENEAVIYFSAPEPISVQTAVLEQSKISQNTSIYKLRITVRNLLSLTLSKIQLKTPINIKGNNIHILEFVDSKGENVKFELLSGQNLTLFLNTLFPKQTVYLNLLLKIEDVESYWGEQLLIQKSRLSTLKDSSSASIRASAEQLLQQINLFQEKNHSKTGLFIKQKKNMKRETTNIRL